MMAGRAQRRAPRSAATKAAETRAETSSCSIVYGLWDVQQSFGSDQNVKLGLGVNVPFGLEIDYRNNWIGRYQRCIRK
jgi:long-subunit fatty acid transport protein